VKDGLKFKISLLPIMIFLNQTRTSARCKSTLHMEISFVDLLLPQIDETERREKLINLDNPIIVS